MEALSERYGWTPAQIREMAAQDVMQYLEIIKQIMANQKAENLKNKR